MDPIQKLKNRINRRESKKLNNRSKTHGLIDKDIMGNRDKWIRNRNRIVETE